jgi:hypothetical protein
VPERPLSTLDFAQTYAGTAAIFVNEFHAGGFECLSDNRQGRAPRLMAACLELTNCNNTHRCSLSES